MLVDPEHGARQDEFRARLGDSGVVTVTVRSPGGLETALLQALVELRAADRSLPAGPGSGEPQELDPGLLAAYVTAVTARNRLLDLTAMTPEAEDEQVPGSWHSYPYPPREQGPIAR